MSTLKEQIETGQYGIYNADCMEIISKMPDNSIDLSVYSPPFAGLYNYSSSAFDFSNCESKTQFLQQYEFLITELSRITKKGRITAVHCTDIVDFKGFLWDFPHEIIKLHEQNGFHYRNRITIWKEPLKVRMRTMVQSLMHKFIIEDSSKCFPATPDYVLLFTKNGDSEIPIEHTEGFKEYFGETPFLENHKAIYGNFNKFQNKWLNFNGDPRENKLSHIIWQRYASSVWDDIRIDNVLPFVDSKDPDDEKHVHPLQLDVIDRIVSLYSNEGEIVLTPFMGVGSEVYSAVSLNRKGIGIELKPSYFKQAKLNLETVNKRFKKEEIPELF